MNALERDVNRLENIKHAQGESAAEHAFRLEYSAGLLLGDKPATKQQVDYYQDLGQTLVKDGVIPKMELSNLESTIRVAESPEPKLPPAPLPGPIVAGGHVVGVEG